jgi:hypothetical protein
MESEILKHFIGMNVEILVHGTWIEGKLQPIVKGVITLLPIGEAASFYGPAACKQDVVQAIRQIRKTGHVEEPVPPVQNPTQVRSSLDQITPGQRFKRNQ